MYQTLHSQTQASEGQESNQSANWGPVSAKQLLRLAIVVAGVGLVAASLLRNWFDIPQANSPAHSFEQIVRQVPACQIWFQVIVALGGLLLLWTAVFFKQRLATTLMASALLFVPLTFPYFVMLQSPEFAADASWLQMQHDNLTWLGGDIYSEAAEGTRSWKANVYWVDPPRQIFVAPIPDWSLSEIGLDKAEDVLVWLGYSNTFCQFARTGWFCAVTGCFLLTLATVLTSAEANFQGASYGAALLGSLMFIFSAIALSGPFGAYQYLQAAARESSERNYEAALQELDHCVRSFPVLSQDSHYLSQRGLLESKTGRRSDYAQLHQALRLESSGRYDQSFEIWEVLCQSDIFALRREALRAVLRFAVQDYNCNRIELARQRLQFVLSHQPGNVKVIHYLQIVSLREENVRSANLMCQWMHEVTDHLNFNTSKVLKYSSQQNAKLTAAVTGDALGTWNRIVEAR